MSSRTAAHELAAYRRALEHHAIVAVTDRMGRITSVNDKFCAISGYTRDELLGQFHSVVNSGHHPRSFFVEMWKTIGSGRSWHSEICNRAKDGSLYWVDTTIVPLVDPDDRPDGYLSIRYDITARKRADAILLEEAERRRAAETLLKEVMEAVPDGIAAFDRDDRLLFFNSAYREFYDRAPRMEPGIPFEDLIRELVAAGQFNLPANDPLARKAWIERRMKEHQKPGRAALQHLSDGRWLQVQERRSPSGFVVGVRTDITALKSAERQVKEQAERDPLTGLYNRRVLLARMARLSKRKARTKSPGALVLIDLDHFKDVNDSMGHSVGDDLLRIVAERIQQTVRSGDLVGRLGGDEFAVLLCEVRSDAAIDRLVSRLGSVLGAPVRLEGRVIRSGASLGVSRFPRDSVEPLELLRFADMALYRAKELGRGSHCYFDKALRSRVERRELIAGRLTEALARRQFSIALQPQFCIQTLAHRGFEVLARWNTPDLSVSPAEFIEVAEQSGAIVALGEQIFDLALAEAARLRRLGLAPGRIAINVAAAQLKAADFATSINQRLERLDLPPDCLEIEVTENVLLDRLGSLVTRTITSLHEMGICIALDDFGTGHASLAHLRRVPVDRMKIDRSFVAGLGTDRGDEAIVRAIITLAKSLGKSVVAEGIETDRQLAVLRSLGCETGQGFLVSRPLSPFDAETYLRAGHPGRLSLTA